MKNKNIDKKSEVEVDFMGFNRTGYPGGFGDRVIKVIKQIIHGKILHLYSGTSEIGEVRVDLKRPEATHNQNVFDFIKSNNAEKQWDWVILDPPYKIEKANIRLKEYGDYTPLSSSILKRREVEKFLLKNAKNVLWLDYCAALPKGFKRKKLWLFLPGSYRHVRVLSWLQRENSLNSYNIDNQSRDI